MDELQKRRHQDYLRQALELARTNIGTENGGPFGALVVKEGVVIASGTNRVLKDSDPTAHAEIVAIREACRVLQSFQLDGCVLYSSCEPCPMCLGAIYWARPEAVIFAAGREDAREAGFDDELIYQEIPRDPQDRRIPGIQMLREEAREIFQEWVKSDLKIPY